MAARMPIACIGAGRMGRGIAQCVAYAGHRVRLLDAKARQRQGFDELRRAALAEVEQGLAAMAALGAFDAAALPLIMRRVEVLPAEAAAEALAGAGIVFEAVPEVIETKRAALRLFDEHADRDAVLASTTSTILATELAQATARKAQFLNAHWLNPAFLMPLVELSPAAETSPDALARVRSFLEGIGKVPIVCKASPGYVVPRIQALAMNEAARLVEEGVASAEDVDKAVTYGFGLRFGVLGLLEFIDWGGGDILYYASRYLAQAFGDDRFAAPKIIDDFMAEGRIGLKTGKGFFDYQNVDVEAYRRQRMAAFLRALEHAGLVRPPVDFALPFSDERPGFGRTERVPLMLNELRSIGGGFDPAVVANIDARLREVGETHGVTILLAIESGSRGWGFPSPDSDYDCRFIYVRPRDDYLSLTPPRDVIEFAPDGLYDVSGWDLAKALRLLLKGNAVVIEWLTSPYAYAGDARFRAEALALARMVAQPRAIAMHYLHLGEQQYRRSLVGKAVVPLKKVFYALRPAVALRWMRLHPGEGVVPMAFDTLLDESEVPAEARAVVDELLALKARTRELGEDVLPRPIERLVEAEFARAREIWPAGAVRPTAAATQAADGLFRRWLEHRP